METNMPDLYTPEQIKQQRLGARLVLMKLMEQVRPDWNGYGLKLKLSAELDVLEAEDE